MKLFWLDNIDFGFAKFYLAPSDEKGFSYNSKYISNVLGTILNHRPWYVQQRVFTVQASIHIVSCDVLNYPETYTDFDSKIIRTETMYKW